MLVAGALRGQLSSTSGIRGAVWPGSSLPKACFCPKQSPGPQTPPMRCPAQCRAHSRTRTPRRPVWFSTRSGTLTANRPSGEAWKRPLLGFLSGVGGSVGCGAVGAGPLGQRPAESHDGQAEEGAEIGRGLGR